MFKKREWHDAYGRGWKRPPTAWELRRVAEEAKAERAAASGRWLRRHWIEALAVVTAAGAVLVVFASAWQ
jgi:hypothetical protein